MTTLYLTDKQNEMKLTKAQALKLELTLNLSEYSRKWSEIGDHLFDFHVNKTKADLLVTKEQFDVLLSFLKKSD